MPAGVACAVDTDGLDAWRVQAVAAEETVHDRSRQLEAQIKEVEEKKVRPMLCMSPPCCALHQGFSSQYMVRC